MDEIIDSWSDSLSERLIEIRYVDIDVMKSAMKSHLRMAIIDCLKIQLTDLEKKRTEMVEKYSSLSGKKDCFKYSSEISKINSKLKETKRFFDYTEVKLKYSAIKKWMRENHPESLADFFKLSETIEQNLRPNTHTS